MYSIKAKLYCMGYVNIAHQKSIVNLGKGNMESSLRVFVKFEYGWIAILSSFIFKSNTRLQRQGPVIHLFEIRQMSCYICISRFSDIYRNV